MFRCNQKELEQLRLYATKIRSYDENKVHEFIFFKPDYKYQAMEVEEDVTGGFFNCTVMSTRQAHKLIQNDNFWNWELFGKKRKSPFG